MGRSHRWMSSLKLSGSPPIDRATSSSSVHVMRSAEGPSSRVLRRPGSADGLGAAGPLPIIVLLAVTSNIRAVYQLVLLAFQGRWHTIDRPFAPDSRMPKPPTQKT